MKPYYETKLGKLYNCDCLEVMAQLDIKADLCLTDPPYRTTSRGNAGNSGGMLRKTENLKGMVFKENSTHIQTWLPMLIKSMQENTHLYIMCNHTNLQEYLNIAENNGLIFTKSLIWEKGNKIMGQFYMSQFEYILFFRLGRAKRINNCGTSDIISVPNKKTKDAQGQNIHDTEKPVKLMEILIENSTEVGNLVLEPFAGSGSTLIAAEILNRKWIGIELDESYCEIAAKRIEKASKQHALFEGIE